VGLLESCNLLTFKLLMLPVVYAHCGHLYSPNSFLSVFKQGEVEGEEGLASALATAAKEDFVGGDVGKK
jgi:hypothetical protein